MASNWTTTPPTEPGWYWARGILKVMIDRWEEVIDIVCVGDFQGDLLVFLNGEDNFNRISDYTHWLGPLEEPTSPVNMEHTDGKPEGK